jgi:uncharacterized protein
MEKPASITPPPRAYHVMTKPIGPICNLDCRYCFYLEKEALYPGSTRWAMNEALLERYISEYIRSQTAPEISFAWQGGEPTLLGVKFFQRVLELQRQYAPPGTKILNALQTNGTLLDDTWGEFLAREQFLVGVSVDGPRHMTDHYRVDKQGQPTFDRVMHGLEVLKRHRVDYNFLCVVNDYNSQYPLETYRWLRDHGGGFIQFIPLVERTQAPSPSGAPHLLPIWSATGPVAPWSVQPAAWGRFLIEIFDHWVRHDIGRTYVQLFDVQLGIWLGLPSSLCIFSETCGAALALEHNGDLYACDHYVYPEYRLGNIMDQSLGELVNSPAQRKFGRDKADSLPAYCRQCPVLFACRGECPKHRFMTTPDGEPGWNYLCAGYKTFFSHIDPYMKRMATLIRQHRAPAELMVELRREELARTDGPRPNGPCPCGSGKKFKICCGFTR